MHKQIAKIESTFLGFEDHGIFTAWLTLDYGGSGQGVGLHTLSYNKDGHIGAPGGINYIIRILKACGVEEWGKLKGRTIYVIKEDDGWDAKVLGIGPLPTESGKDFLFDEVVLWPDLVKNK